MYKYGRLYTIFDLKFFLFITFLLKKLKSPLTNILMTIGIEKY
jgi:hypothetical protein